MKILAKFLFAVLFPLAVTVHASAQKKIAEGVVTYSVTYELPADKQQYADALPKEVTCYFRGDSTAAIVNQGGAVVKGVSVFKSDYHSLIIDDPTNGKKIVVVMTADEVAKEKAAIPDYTGKKTGEKQVVGGYNCEKVVVTDPKTNASYDLWITRDIDIPVTSVSRAVVAFGGVPVKFVTFNNGIKINAELKSAQPQTIPAGFFTAAKDYQSMSYTELKGGN